MMDIYYSILYASAYVTYYGINCGYANITVKMVNMLILQYVVLLCIC